MDHRQIEDANIPDLYLMDKLEPELRQSFEEHFVSCHECLDRLQATESLRDSLRKHVSSRASFVPARRHLIFPRYVAAVAVVLFLTVAALAVPLFLQMSSGRRQLRQSESRLAEERAKTEALNNQIAALSQMPAYAPVVPLVMSRSGDSTSVNNITMPASPQWILFSLELPA